MIQFQPEVSDMKKSLSLVLVSLFALALITTGCTTATSTTTTTTAASGFSLTSSAFTDGGAIPNTYANTGQGISGATNASVPLSWTNVPSGTVAYALVMLDTYLDPDSVHWMVVNIPVATSSLAAGESASGMPAGSTEITNDYSSGLYIGPFPPSGDPAHTYEFTLYALSGTVEASSISNLTTFNSAVSAKLLGFATLSGTFTR